MSTSYMPYLPDQQHLLPCALQDWLQPGHLAYFIGDTVDSLDIKAFQTRYRGGWLAQPAFSSGHDGQPAGVCLGHRGARLAQNSQEAA